MARTLSRLLRKRRTAAVASVSRTKATPPSVAGFGRWVKPVVKRVNATSTEPGRSVDRRKRDANADDDTSVGSHSPDVPTLDDAPAVTRTNDDGDESTCAQTTEQIAVALEQSSSLSTSSSSLSEEDRHSNLPSQDSIDNQNHSAHISRDGVGGGIPGRGEGVSREAQLVNSTSSSYRNDEYDSDVVIAVPVVDEHDVAASVTPEVQEQKRGPRPFDTQSANTDNVGTVDRSKPARMKATKRKKRRTTSTSSRNSVRSGSIATGSISGSGNNLTKGARSKKELRRARSSKDSPDEKKRNKPASLSKFTGKPGQKRCLAIGRGGELCPNIAEGDGIIYCQQHIGISNPVIRLAQGEATASCQSPSSDMLLADQQSSLDIVTVADSAKRHTGNDNEQGKLKKSAFPRGNSTRKKHPGQIQCMAITRKGNQCTFYVTEGCFCHLHEHIAESQQAAALEIAFSADNIPSESQPLDDYMSTDSEDRSQTKRTSLFDYSDDDSEDGEERPYTHKEFLTMWKQCEDYCGEVTEEIESTRRVRGANTKIAPEDSDGQLKAQYGRLLPRAMRRLMQKILCLNKDDIFLDIGHGIGNTCLQAAMTIGCESRGIEVVYGRQSVAEVFRDHLILQHEDVVSDGKKRVIGSVHLRHGRLEDRHHREFLTDGVTKAYVNNFNGVFAERSAKGNDKYFLDDFVGGLFALMKPGTILVSLHPINLGPTRSEANRTRKKHGLSESTDASFYEVDRILLGKACDTVKWNQFSGNQRDIYIYKYTRVQQSPSTDGTVFMCCNPACPLARDNVLIPATDETEQGRLVISHCQCKITRKNLRRQTRKTYTGY